MEELPSTEEPPNTDQSLSTEKPPSSEQSPSMEEPPSSEKPPQNSFPAKEDTVTEVKEDDNTAPNVQMSDNIRLNFQYVDVIYEITDGRSNIEILTSEQQHANAVQPVMESAAVLEQSVQERSVLQTAIAFSDNMPQQESSSVAWHEVIKILLLAALFIVPKPKHKVISQSETDAPRPKHKEEKSKKEKRRKEKE